MKRNTEDLEPVASAGLSVTPTEAARRLAAGAARLSARRRRDLLPGRIQTKRLLLRAPIRGDVPDLVQLADNPAVSGMMSGLPSPYSRADAIGFIEIVSLRPDERPYAITVGDTLIGVAGFHFPAESPPELGYWLGEPHWGQGFATEAVKGLIEAAQATGAFPVIAARVIRENEGSLRVLERLGFARKSEGPSRYQKFAGRTVVVLELEQPRWM